MGMVKMKKVKIIFTRLILQIQILLDYIQSVLEIQVMMRSVMQSVEVKLYFLENQLLIMKREKRKKRKEFKKNQCAARNSSRRGRGTFLNYIHTFICLVFLCDFILTFSVIRYL